MDDVHTETEARRLFAAAAETIPPGHDLLDGVRRRRARHRRRAQAALAASSAAAVAAGALMAVTAAGAPSALAAVTGAAAKTASESYRVSMISTRTGKPKFPLNLSPSGPMRATGEFDPTRQIGEETASVGRQVRYIGGYVYWTAPSYGVKAVQGKPWVMARSAPIGRISSSHPPLWQRMTSVASGLGVTVGPQNLLTLLKSTSTVRDEGPASGPGWTGTRYSFSTAVEYGPYRIVRGTVDVDRQGRVRRLIATTVYGKDFSSQTGIDSTTNDVTFSDFGLRVSVTAPPASQVYKEPGNALVLMAP
jgi:hypothetical protein